MEDRFNTIAGWTLFSGIVALGLSSLSGKYYEANKSHPPHTPGYVIEGVVSSQDGAAAAVPIETLLAAADPAKGEAVFKKCTSCHTVTAGGANGIGPNLNGVVGEGIAAGRGGFAFSDALKSHGGSWSFANLNEWLTSPKKFANGTKMSFAGLGSAEDRANLMVYLNSQGSNVPLPAAPPAGDAAAVADTAAGTAPPAKGEPAKK
ncbi:MAG TPA: cytochrome c family protein [Novosphingobium sp.]|nr:cytochrome c family protein [Novosphingobium sp.]